MGTDEERLTLTVPEVARLLRISRGTCYEAVHTGQIPSLRFGRSIRIPRSALERLLTGQEEDIDRQYSDEAKVRLTKIER